MVLVSYDPDAAATYVELSRAAVSRTVEIQESVMADLDADGQPVGFEFLVMPDKISPEMLQTLRQRFPDLDVLRDPTRWLPVAS